MNNLEKLKLYENWLQRGIDLQESGKGNIRGYEDKLNPDGVHEVKEVYADICLKVFNELFSENKKMIKEKEYSSWLRKSVLIEQDCRGNCQLILENK
jgi:hypothetical protein